MLPPEDAVCPIHVHRAVIGRASRAAKYCKEERLEQQKRRSRNPYERRRLNGDVGCQGGQTVHVTA